MLKCPLGCPSSRLKVVGCTLGCPSRAIFGFLTFTFFIIIIFYPFVFMILFHLIFGLHFEATWWSVFSTPTPSSTCQTFAEVLCFYFLSASGYYVELQTGSPCTSWLLSTLTVPVGFSRHKSPLPLRPLLCKLITFFKGYLFPFLC